MLENGTIIDGKYKILNKIGQGGMSVVYLAMNEKANKQWAIKEVRKDVTENFEVIKQGLITETDLLKNLKHPNLPSIVDVIDTEDTFLIVMDYIEGNPLSVLLEENGAQPQNVVVDIALQLCDVLSYLHTREKPIIYRDMKPANVMLKPNGEVVLIDFGIAREYKRQNIADTVCLGTQGYAAPEQFGGQGQTDARTDIYCLGATLYHLLTGHNPSEPPYEMYPIRYWNENFSSGLEEIILTCTQKNPMDRYQNCEELRYALEHYMELDDAYRKWERRQLRIFAVISGMAAFCFAAALGFHAAGNSLKNDNYETYLSEALATSTAESAISYYREAICLEPEKEEAYAALLDKMLEDDNFTEEESYTLREVLQYKTDNSGSCEEKLAENTAAYEDFSYQLGLAYFYSYEENGNKNNAKKWLKIASEAQSLDESKVERAKRLLKISEYYLKIGVQSKSGDEATSYKDYWEDLKSLSEGNLVEMDNEVTALMMYNEAAYQIATNAQKFAEAGVEKEEMSAMLEQILEHLETDFSVGEENRLRIEELMEKVRRNVEAAERELEINASVRREEVTEETEEAENDIVE